LSLAATTAVVSGATSPTLRATPASSGSTTVVDTFARTVSNGLGTADSGGTWVIAGPTRPFSVKSGAARIALARPGTSAQARLSATSSSSTDLRATIALSGRPSGGGAYVSILGRAVQGGDYRAKLRYRADGQVTLSLVRTVNGHESTLAASLVKGIRSDSGQTLGVRLSVTGTGPTRISAKAWPAGASEPARWQLSASDGTAALQRPGTVGLVGYLSTSARTSQTVVIDNLRSAALQPTTHQTTSPRVATSTTSAPRASTSTSSRRTATTSPAKASSTRPQTSAGTTTRATSSTGSATTTKAASPPKQPQQVTTAGQPGPGNTGVPSGTKLKIHNGDLIIKKAGTVVDGLDIRGWVRIDASNVTIKNSVIRGGDPAGATSNRSLILSTGSGVLIEDSELVPTHPSVRVDGLKGHGFTARRLDIHGTVDTAVIYGDNTTIEHSWLHGNRHYASDPNQGGGASHDDGVQIVAGRNLRLDSNTIGEGTNAALMISQGYGVVAQLSIVNNWLGGGACTINVTQKPRGPIQGMVVSGNHFSRTSQFNCPMIVDGSTSPSMSNNTYTGTSTSIGSPR
jgi:hypothetical protein